MRPHFVVVDEPDVSGLANLRQGPERIGVEKLIAHAPVKRFDPGILRRFARINKVQLDVVIDRPLQHDPGAVFGPVVDSQSRWVAAYRGDVVERTDHSPAGQREIGVDGKAFTTVSR